MPGRDNSKQKKNLQERIRNLEEEINPPEKGESPIAQANMGWRMVVDLVAGVGLGFAIGYGLDILFETRPLNMILFVLLGFGAGINLMLRTAKEMKKPETHINEGNTPD
ncbi:MAG: AtpZ/AtpI family protein [Rhodobacteraceae bacterium]|nr:AtpZ/AtpI family protein [Paracoccaceae bacterium]MCY4248990.1 AtpZ/AtpI family protein [Paracoccaceae bacterium]MCY4308602.1 AtpZ/AtpI family protein [Paracoccaceae bacterium]